jgi:hypothetical protein
MMHNLVSLRWLLLILLIAIFTGCSDDDDTPTGPGDETPTQAIVTFAIDDTADEIYMADDGLAWKGSFIYDPATRELTYDAAWTGPYVMLFDDGPLSGGGHEPEGAVAGDHIWSASVLVDNTEETTFEYGAIEGSVDGADGTWIWEGPNGTVTVPAEAEGPIAAVGLVVEAVDPPLETAIVTFAIDDTANQTYTAGDGLAWKGSFSYDSDTRILTPNGAWPGPFPLLYDDGPLSTGGHEPEGAVADDHIWSVSVLVGNEAQTTLEYGAIRGSVDGSDGQWIWIGSNGTVTIPAGVQGPIAAPGLTLPANGDIDMLLTLDLSANGANLDPVFQGVDYSANAKVKGSAWGWGEVSLVDDGTDGDQTAGDGIFSFLLSAHAGPHDGLLLSGQQTEFVFVLGGAEYRAAGGDCSNVGAAAALDLRGGWTAADILVNSSGNGNTYITVP